MNDGWDYGSVDDQNSADQGMGETDVSEEVLVGLGLGKLTRRVGQRRRHQLDNYLRSIKHDAQFVLKVVSVCEEKGWGLWPNLRNGLWYVDPGHATGTCYFKSTDGHSGKWDFSASRLNLHLALHAAHAGGAVLVDSTRRGKAYPDALTYTVPIWCAVINAYLTRASPTTAPPPPSPPPPPTATATSAASTTLPTATSNSPPPPLPTAAPDPPTPGARQKGGDVCVGGITNGGDVCIKGEKGGAVGVKGGVMRGDGVCVDGVINGGDVCVKGGVSGDACEEDAPSVLSLPPWVPPSEAHRIRQLLPSWVPRLHTALDGTSTLTELQHALRMPRDTDLAPATGTSARGVRYRRFRPLWIKHGDDLSRLWEHTALQSKEYVWIVCVSASRHRSAEEHREHHSWHYIQGAGDDAENWARPHNITPQTFWAHIAHNLLVKWRAVSYDTDDVESVVRSITTDPPPSDPRTATTARAASTHTHARPLVCTARAIVIGDTGIHVGTHECVVAPGMAGAWGRVLRIVDATKTRRAASRTLDRSAGGSQEATIAGADGTSCGSGGGGCSGCGGVGGDNGSRGGVEDAQVGGNVGGSGGADGGCGGGGVEDSLTAPADGGGDTGAINTEAVQVSCTDGSSSRSSRTIVTIELTGARREWAYRVIPQALHAYHMYATADPRERPRFLITCDNGTDASVAVAVALLLAYFDADLRPLPLYTSETSVTGPPRPVHDKDSVRRCVMSVQRYHGTAHPRREWIKEVRVYFSSRPRPATATAKDAMDDVDG